MPSEPHSRDSLFWSAPDVPKEPEDPGFFGSLGPAFRLENEIGSALQIANQPKWRDDPEFDLKAALGGSKLTDNHARDFVGVGSAEEFDYRSRQIERENADRAQLAAAGVPGIIAAMGAGLLSPTTLLPLTGPAKGVKGVAQAFGLAAGAVGAQEAVLQQTQASRTAEESAVSIAAGTVLGGLLGSAAVMLTRADFDRISGDMATQPGYVTIHPSVPIGSAAGAASPVEWAGRLKQGFGIDTLAQIGPVSRVGNDPNATASWMMANAETGGLIFERNAEGIATARGGTVAARIKGWAEPLARSLNFMEERWADYDLGTDVRIARQTRARLHSFFTQGRREKLDFDQFKHEVARAMFSKDTHEVPEVRAAAEFFRKKLYDPLLDEAKSVGILPENIDLKGAESYLNRIYDINMIVSRPDVFIEKLANHIERKLIEGARSRFLKVRERNAQAKQDIEDLERSDEEVESLREQINAELERMGDDPLAAIADEIETTKGASRATKAAQAEADAEAAARGRALGRPVDRPSGPAMDFGKEVRELKKKGGEALGEYLKNRSQLRRRLRNLSRSAIARDYRQRRALERIELIEDQNLAALRRAGRTALSISKKLSKLTDEQLDEALSKLKNQFADLDAMMERADARLAKLEEDSNAGILGQEQRLIQKPTTPPDQIETGKPFYAKLYHGTKQTLDRLDPSKSPESVVYLTDKKKIAGLYAEKPGSQVHTYTGEFKNPLVIDATAPFPLQTSGKFSVSVSIDYAKKQGHDVLVLKNIQDHGGTQTQYLALKMDDLKETVTPADKAGIPQLIETGDNTYSYGEWKFTKDKNTVIMERVGERQVVNSLQDAIKTADSLPERELGDDAFQTATRASEEGLAAEARQEARGERLSTIAEKIEDAQTFDREAAREAVEAAYQASLERVNRINSRRAVRAEKLRKRADKYGPEGLTKEIEGIEARAKARTERFTESIRTRADDYDLETGEMNFKTAAREMAEDIKSKIIGNDRRIAGMEILVGERGPELSRMLDIDEREFADFLIFDIEHLARAYSRTMAADVEMARRYGSVNAVDWWKRLRDSFKQEEEALANRLKTKGTDVSDVQKLRAAVSSSFAASLAKTKADEAARHSIATEKAIEAGFKSLTPAEQKANRAVMEEFRKLWKRQRQIEEDLHVVFDRLRSRRGIPENADGTMYRMGKAALALNTLRLMGSVVTSSIPDMARPVMKYGLVSVFRDGFVPLVTNLKTFRMTAAEAKAAGVGLDTILASRAASVFDIFDDVGRGTKGERALQFAANNFGNIALFNQWTSGMKQFTAVIVHAQMMRAMKTVLAEANPKPKKLAKANEFLASLGIDNTNIGRIWEQIHGHGAGDDVGGVRWPNTEAWTDVEAKRTYRAALAQAIDDTVVTPGAERPNWVDQNIGLRLVAQFRSFALSSTTKTMMAGLQQRDMAVVNGMMLSLALGTISYYLWALTTGGKAYEDMLNATPEQWADEAIDRSGLLAVLGEVRRVGERIPATADLVTFSGQRTTRRQGADLVDAVLGPTAGAAKSASSFLMGLDDPTEATLGFARDLTPFQNVFYIRRLIDAIESGVAEGINLPERRQ